MRCRPLRAAVSGLLLIAAAIPALAADDSVAARQALMKEIGQTAFGIFRNTVEPLDGAQVIADNFADVGAFFPAGSEGGHALPAIWSDPDGFSDALSNAQQAADELVAAAESGDHDAFMTQFRELDGVCNQCHSKYRAELR